MKRFRPVTLTAKFIDRRGSRREEIPLSLNVGTARASACPPASVQPETHDVLDRVVQVDFIDEGETPVTAHEERRISEIKKWSSLREVLVNVAVEESCLPPDTLCVYCLQNPAVARCVYCGPRQFFCLDCSRELHRERNVFHVLQLWKVNINK